MTAVVVLVQQQRLLLLRTKPREMLTRQKSLNTSTKRPFDA
jgi:hypothetical protein